MPRSLYAFRDLADILQPPPDLFSMKKVDEKGVPTRDVVLIDPEGLDYLNRKVPCRILKEWENRFVLYLPNDRYFRTRSWCAHVANLFFAMVPAGAWNEIVL